MKRKWRLDMFRRRLRHEGLEQRNLLAGMVGDSPWQNPLDADDLNCDGALSPADALVAINALNGGLTGQLAGKSAPPSLHGHIAGALADFMDANGDGQLSPADPLEVINALNSGLHRGKPDSGLPDTDQPGTIAGAPSIDLTHNFAKVRAAIDPAGDVDYFKVTPTKTQLNVALFSSGGQVMSVSVVDADGNSVLDPVSTDAGSHRPARGDATVTPGTDYYIVVKGDTGVTGGYGLTVLNYNPADFTPPTDSPLGTDSHPDAPPGTALTFDHGHVRVSSNIDTAGDKDVFDVTPVDGKLAIEAEADFPLTVTVTDKDGNAVDPLSTTHEHLLLFNVTAAAGPYSITVAAANGTDTGAYHMNVVNIPVGASDDDGSDDEGADDSDAGDVTDNHDKPTPETLFTKLDANGDGSITLAEVPMGKSPLVEKVFANWDADNDGKLSLDEFVAGLETLPPFLPHPPDDAGAPLLTAH